MQIPSFLASIVVAASLLGCSSQDPAPDRSSTCGYVEGAECSADAGIDLAFCFCRESAAIFVCCYEGRVHVEICAEQHHGCGVFGVDTGTPAIDAASDSRTDATDGD